MHRNSQTRIYNEYSTYFITTNTFNRHPYFKNEIFCKLFIEELRILKEVKKCEIYAFVILYNHIHLLIRPDLETANISEIMRSLKTNFSRNVNRSERNEGRVTSPGLHVAVQEYLEELIKLKGNVSVPLFKWQDRFHDHIIRNQKDFERQLNYINTNHLKHNLPENWSYVGYNFQDLLDL